MSVDNDRLAAGGAPVRSRIILSADACDEFRELGREQGHRVTVGGLAGESAPAGPESPTIVRSIVPFVTKYGIAPSVEESQDLALGVIDAGLRPIGWFCADPGLEIFPPSLDLGTARVAFAPWGDLLLLFNPSTEEGAFFVWRDDRFVPVEGRLITTPGEGEAETAAWNEPLRLSPGWQEVMGLTTADTGGERGEAGALLRSWLEAASDEVVPDAAMAEPAGVFALPVISTHDEGQVFDENASPFMGVIEAGAAVEAAAPVTESPPLETDDNETPAPVLRQGPVTRPLLAEEAPTAAPTSLLRRLLARWFGRPPSASPPGSERGERASTEEEDSAASESIPRVPDGRPEAAPTASEEAVLRPATQSGADGSGPVAGAIAHNPARAGGVPPGSGSGRAAGGSPDDWVLDLRKRIYTRDGPVTGDEAPGGPVPAGEATRPRGRQEALALDAVRHEAVAAETSRPTAAEPRTATVSAAGALIFLAGLVVSAGGIVLLRSHLSMGWFLAPQTEVLKHELDSTNDALLLGSVVTLLGAVLAATGAWRAMPDLLADKPIAAIRLRWDVWALGALAGAAACSAVLYIRLAGHEYSHWNDLLFVVSLALAGFGIFRLSDRSAVGESPSLTRLDALLATLLAAGTVGLGSIGLVSWKFAWVGDEGSFFGLARDIAAGRSWNLFDLRGVYDVHPVLDSALQALGIKLLGPNVVVWRASELIVLAAGSALAYLLGTTLFGRWAGLTAGVVIGSSHYLLAFSRIGYNNTHMLLYTTLAMLMLALSWRTGRPVYLFIFGVALGACLYTFLGALLVWPVAALLILIVLLRGSAASGLVAVVATLSGFFMTVVPALLATPLSHVLDAAVQNSGSQAQAADRLDAVRRSLEQSLMLFWDNERALGHFVAGPLVDVVTGVLLVIGLAICVRRLDRRAERLVFIWFAFGLVLVAASSPGAAPLLTRLLFVLPPGALLAGVAAAKFVTVVRSSAKWPPAFAWGPVVIALLAIPPLNLWQLLVATPAVARANPQMMVMKAIEEHSDRLVVQVGPQPALPQSDTAIMLRAYPDLLDRYRYAGLADLSAGHAPRVADSAPVYMVAEADKDILPAVQRAVPPSYRLVTDSDPGSHATTWLLVPPAGSPSESAPPGLPITLSPSLEVNVEPLPGGRAASPGDVVADSQGQFYVAGTADVVIRKYDAKGRLLGQWGNTGSGPPVFRSLAGLAIGPGETLYALDPRAGTILAFDTSGQMTGVAATGLDERARSISVTPGGNLLVAGGGAEQVLRYRPIPGASAPSGEPAVRNIPFDRPQEALESGLGDLFVLDSGGSRLTHVSWWYSQVPDAAFRHEWPVGAVGSSVAGRFALDSQGRLYVAEAAARQIAAYDSTGRVLRRWPTPGSGSPGGLYVSAESTLLVTYPAAGTVQLYRLSP